MTTVHDPLGPPLVNTPDTRVTGAAGGPYTVDTKSGVGAWKVATIGAVPAGSLVQLPNGLSYGPGQKALLTAAEAALIAPTALSVGSPPPVASVVDVTAIVIVPAAGDDLSLKLTGAVGTIDLTTQLQVTAGASGPLVPSSDVRWSSAAPLSASVDGKGLVTAKLVHAGVVITAQWNGLTDTETIVVVA